MRLSTDPHCVTANRGRIRVLRGFGQMKPGILFVDFVKRDARITPEFLIIPELNDVLGAGR